MRYILIILFLLSGSYRVLAQPVNDECENATEFISIGTREMWWCSNDRQFRISDATISDRDDPTCHPDTNKILKDVWFKFTPSEDNVTFVFSFDSAVTNLDKESFPEGTRLTLFTISVYSGNCQERTLHNCEFFGGDLSLRYRITDLVPNENYYMKVATPIDSLVPQNEDDTVGNFHFCLFSDTQEVDPTLCNNFSITTSSDTLIDYGGRTTLTAQGDISGIDFTWYLGDSVICANCPDVDVAPTKSTEYQVVASNTDDCVTSRLVNVDVRIRDIDRIIYVPNAFTPNGDLVNDKITIFGGKLLQSVIQLDIYDRWRNLAFRKMNFDPNDIEQGWDGSGGTQYYNGGTFVYLTRVQFVDGSTKTFQGSFHLIR